MEKVKGPSNWVRGSCIGSGSYGTVSLAVDKSGGQVFAVKSVDLSSCLEAQAEALENEIRILRSLSSPWVVEYLGDDSTAEGCAASYRNLHLEYMPGGTAADLAKHTGVDVDENTVRSYTWCVVSALSYVHSMGIVHCDVKGKNVLLGPSTGVAKLSDFGSSAEFATATLLPRGSPLWMAPEVIRREYQGPESDVWSLGCTVIEMLTGRPAWGDHGSNTLCRIGYSNELPELPSQLSELCRDFLDKCLRRDLTERWSCDQLLRHPFISSSAPPNPITYSSPRCVLDWFDSEFCDDEFEKQDNSSLASESRNQSGDGRIGKLATSAGANWESDGWIVVRNVSCDETAEVSDACWSGDGVKEGTSWEYANITRREEEIQGSTSSVYADSVTIGRTNSGCYDSGDGDAVDSGGERRRLEAGSSCHCQYGFRGLETWDGGSGHRTERLYSWCVGACWECSKG